MKIKNIFIPSRYNHYHPHALRPLGLAIVCLLILLSNGVYNFQAAHTFRVLGYATSISPSELVSLTNQQRQANGLASLSANSALSNAANAKAVDMFAKDYWAHVSPDGTQPWTFITNAGYSYSAAGENLAKDFYDSDGAMTGWMNSPEHRDNILNPAYKDIGIAVVNGTLQGSETTLIVAFYAAPAAPKAAPSVAAPTTAPAPAAAEASSPAKKSENPDISAPTPTATQPPVAETPATVPSESSSTHANSTQPLQEAKILKDYQGVSQREQMNWAQKVSIFLLSVIALINILKHTVVWRTQRRGWRHIWLRSHPAAQYIMILAAILVMLTSGTGVIR